jgi:hypothetical protein
MNSRFVQEISRFVQQNSRFFQEVGGFDPHTDCASNQNALTKERNMKRLISYITSQQGSLTIALAVIAFGSAFAILHAFGGASPAALVAPIFLPA